MRCGPGADRGSATAEIAVALPSLVLVLGLAVATVHAAGAYIACVDAARVGARALARGDPAEAAHALAAESAPESADISLTADSGFARVRVAARVPLGPWDDLAVPVIARAATPLEGEPGAAPPAAALPHD
ncbi:TadE family type IV pilus minor pilin [Streptomonospora nanhaiensis]|uniref:Flp pilus assembly protein TadG n=1 Tax=Streptomonospora nanhaiensis TaxID=1323731 RepID=A0A853BPH1_9ACTN|nr:TadE family type IV pilus minor pilin [Streptomonospora nanhaiensis]MBV2366792.1 pilus assembly protein [Streptomonospora nanhaiensis]MBX9387694.1 pilus assembly protein [Streptomonospora nanhaiensis]NYI96880.1 Flp pilus assembly protein TadG [Streptomonospora nanhaiensis]